MSYLFYNRSSRIGIGGAASRSGENAVVVVAAAAPPLRPQPHYLSQGLYVPHLERNLRQQRMRQQQRMPQQRRQQQVQIQIQLPPPERPPSLGPPFSATRVTTVQTEVSPTGRLAQLELVLQPAAKAAIQAALFEYLSCSLSPARALPSLHMERAVQIMEQYTHSERLVQLQLAVWKAMCILEMKVSDCGYYQALEWMASGWKSCKAQHQDSNAAAIILFWVMEFLD